MTLPILRPLRSSRLFTPTSLAAVSSLAALCLAVACSSTDTVTNPGTTAGDDSGVDSGDNTPVVLADAAGGSSTTGDDDGAVSDASVSTGCVMINGAYAEMSSPGDGSNSLCPTTSDTCTFVTDPATCKFTAGCSKGDGFNGTVDSTGKATYTQNETADGITVPATCVLQFNSDLSAFNAVCNASTPIGTLVCDGSGVKTTDVADATAD